MIKHTMFITELKEKGVDIIIEVFVKWKTRVGISILMKSAMNSYQKENVHSHINKITDILRIVNTGLKMLVGVGEEISASFFTKLARKA